MSKKRNPPVLSKEPEALSQPVTQEPSKPAPEPTPDNRVSLQETPYWQARLEWLKENDLQLLSALLMQGEQALTDHLAEVSNRAVREEARLLRAGQPREQAEENAMAVAVPAMQDAPRASELLERTTLDRVAKYEKKQENQKPIYPWPA